MKNVNVGFTFRDLQYIVAVAEELNFHKAAARCCVSQSTLSIQLKKCEAYLGVTLFARNQHSVALMAVGVEVVAFARVAIEAAQLIKEHARRKLPHALVPSRQTATRTRALLARTVFDLKDQSRFLLSRA